MYKFIVWYIIYIVSKNKRHVIVTIRHGKQLRNTQVRPVCRSKGIVKKGLVIFDSDAKTRQFNNNMY